MFHKHIFAETAVNLKQTIANGIQFRHLPVPGDNISKNIRKTNHEHGVAIFSGLKHIILGKICQ